MNKSVNKNKAALLFQAPMKEKPDLDSPLNRPLYLKSKYRRIKAAYKRKHPHCEACKALGTRLLTEFIHHKTPHNQDPELLHSWDNLLALCPEHHGMYQQNKELVLELIPDINSKAVKDTF